MPDEVVESADERQIDHDARFRYLSVKLAHFWNRWRREYLADLREYHNNKGGSGGQSVEMLSLCRKRSRGGISGRWEWLRVWCVGEMMWSGVR